MKCNSKKYKTRKMKTKKNKSKKIKTNKNKTKKNIKGGELRSNCLADPKNFPKCGKEGCVYLDDDNSVIKKQWKTLQELPSYYLSIEGQTNSKPYAPLIDSTDIKPCNLITTIGNENKAPCFVKRHRNTRTGEKILYEEEQRDSWCRNYGIQNQCTVDKNMYDNFKNNVNKVSFQGKPNRSINLPEVDDMIDSIKDEDLGNLYGKIEIDESFTNLNPVFLTDIKMNRIKGITIAELIKEMYEILFLRILIFKVLYRLNRVLIGCRRKS